MGVMPVPKLLITMSLPMIISMLVQALYNVVDSVFVAQINEEALTAVSLAFPVQKQRAARPSGLGPAAPGTPLVCRLHPCLSTMKKAVHHQKQPPYADISPPDRPSHATKTPPAR